MLLFGHSPRGAVPLTARAASSTVLPGLVATGGTFALDEGASLDAPGWPAPRVSSIHGSDLDGDRHRRFRGVPAAYKPPREVVHVGNCALRRPLAAEESALSPIDSCGTFFAPTLPVFETSIREADWKAATVIAGSVVEALLLDALLQELPADIATATATLVENRTLSRAPPAMLERWDLHQFTEVAHLRQLIEAPTAAQVRIAKEFRNLIHPGRAMRLAQRCDRRTALAATAALEFVVRDLTP
jgi:hypothetical protein